MACTLQIGQRVVLRAGAPPEAEFALFDPGDIEVAANEPGVVREVGYRSTAAEAIRRLEVAGLSMDLATSAAEALGPRLSVAYARGPTIRRVVLLFGPCELFESTAYNTDTRRYEGAWLDLAALSTDVELARANVLFQAIHLRALLAEVPEETPVVLDTRNYAMQKRAGERSFRRMSLEHIADVPKALLALGEKPPSLEVREEGPSRANLLEALQARVDICSDPQSHDRFVAIEAALSARTRPQRGPLSDPDMWALEEQLSSGNAAGVVDKVDGIEKRRGRDPATAYLRARASLVSGREAPVTVAEKAASLAMSMNSFPEATLLAAEAWAAAGHLKRAAPFARDLIDTPGADDALRARAVQLLAESEVASAAADLRAGGWGRRPSDGGHSSIPPPGPIVTQSYSSVRSPVAPEIPPVGRTTVPPARPASIPPPRPISVPPRPSSPFVDIPYKRTESGSRAPFPVEPGRTPSSDSVFGEPRPNVQSEGPERNRRRDSDRASIRVAPYNDVPVGPSRHESAFTRSPSQPEFRGNDDVTVERYNPVAPMTPLHEHIPRPPPTGFRSERPPAMPSSGASVRPPGKRELDSVVPRRESVLPAEPRRNRPVDGSVPAPPPDGWRGDGRSSLPRTQRSSALMKGASQPPFRTDSPAAHMHIPKAPAVPRSALAELAEQLALPPGLQGQPGPADVIPTSVIDARIHFTFLARQLGELYRSEYGIELRADVSGIEAIQARLLEDYPDGEIATTEQALALRRHGALLSEVLARSLHAFWVDIAPADLGYWAMVVPSTTRVWPFGRMLRFIAMGHRERDLVSYYLELHTRADKV